MSWQIYDRPHYERSGLWYVGAVAIGLGLIAYALVTLNFLFAFIILMFGIILLINANREPNRIAVSVTPDGIQVVRRRFAWKELKSFWIVYEPPAVKNLCLDFKSAWRPHLAIPLERQNPVEARKALLAFIEEDATREDESLTDFVGRVLKI